MCIARIPNRSSPPAFLLRESYREGDRVKTRTLANLSKLPHEAISLLKRFLRGERFVSAEAAFQSVRSWHHGHVLAVREAMKRLRFDRLIDTGAGTQRDRVSAMVTARNLSPGSKLATTRWWETTSLARLLALEETDEDDLYAAMDWLLQRQERIEQALAKRHLREDALVLYDLSSSWFEGSRCPLAALGHNRDDKKGKLQVNYGLLTDARGCPVAVSVFKGNTVDTQTLLPQVQRLQGQFGIERAAIVGDRGMISQTQIDVRLGKVINKYKVGKHFILDIRDAGFGFRRDERRIAEEAALDGIHVIRTSLDSARMSTAQAVRSYKSLGQVERAFRSIKTGDLKVRPIHHHLETRVRAHIFLCMLAGCGFGMM